MRRFVLVDRNAGTPPPAGISRSMCSSFPVSRFVIWLVACFSVGSSGTSGSYAFVPGSGLLLPVRTEGLQNSIVSKARLSAKQTKLEMINLGGWFRGNEGNSIEKDDALARDGKQGVVSVIDHMESFKKSQKVGKATGALVGELMASTVEGFSADGKIKVTVDCQQKPLSVEIDEQYFDSTNVLDFSNAMTAAIMDAHQKSRDKIDDKMKSFFADMGIQQKKE